VLADAGSIPAISTNNKGQLFFGWPFLLAETDVELKSLTGSLKSPGATLNITF